MQVGNGLRFDFSAGELGPTLAGRFDMPQYEMGAQRVENCVTLPQGGLTKMPGTRFIAETSKPRKLVPFIVTAEDSYIIEFGPTIRIWNQAGEEHGTIESTIYDTAEKVQNIQIAGKDNWRVVVSRGLPPRRLVMDPSNKGFTLEEVTWIGKPFNTAALHPNSVAYHQERLHFATDSTVHGSKTGNYNANRDFTIVGENAKPDDAYEYTIGGRDANEIIWMDAYGTLIAATASAEYTLDGMAGNAIAEIRPQSTYGSSRIPGRLYGDSVIFLQRHGRKIREYVYSDRTSPYMGMELTIMSPHILGAGVVQTAFSQDPIPIVWFVREDGQMVGMTRDRTIEVLGFHRHTTQGKYLSVATLPALDRDQIWVIVERVIDGVEKQYLERFESFGDKDLEDSFFVHSGITQRDDEVYTVDTIVSLDPFIVTLDRAPSSLSVGSYFRMMGREFRVGAIDDATIDVEYTDASGPYDASADPSYQDAELYQVWERVTGLEHLEGEEVAILADGGIHAPKTVDAGVVVLDRWSRVTTVGLRYRALAETMPGVLGQLSRMVKMDARFYHSMGCQMGDTEERLREMLWLRSGKDQYIGPAQIITGDKRDIFPGLTNRVESFVIANDYPLPWTVLALSIQGAVSTEV